ncbi:MAG TPA: glycosyltransferase family 4 protein [Candidatus Thermoplasmatota archaeon]|nr:glycosyltransferase family 4 protein [Candidatus Thermoplasmatota archaeon]
MTVVHVYGAYIPSRTEGISANVHGLCNALARAGAHVRQDCVPTDLGRLNSHRTLAASAWRGARCARVAGEDLDTALVHHHVSLLSTALPARLGGRLGGWGAGRSRNGRAPVLVHAWNAHYEPGTAAGLPARDRFAHRVANGPEATALALRGIDDLVVATAYQARQVEALGFAGRLHIVPNGVDLETCRPRRPEETEVARHAFGLDGDPVLLYYGHATPWKGLRTLMAALPQVLREHPRAQVLLSLTGYGRDRAWVLEEVRRQGLEGRVQCIGPSDLARLHAAADVAVLPAPAGVGTACYPNVLLECLAGGLPLVATRVGCVPEVVADGRTGLLAAPGEAGSLAQRIGELAGDPVLRRRLASQARRSMESGFGWDAVAQRMLAVYRSIGIQVPPAIRPPRPAPAHGVPLLEGAA